jgi:hypothetical protein
MKASNHGDSLGSMTLTSSLVFSGQISLFNIGQETSKKIQIKTNPHLQNEILRTTIIKNFWINSPTHKPSFILS